MAAKPRVYIAAFLLVAIVTSGIICWRHHRRTQRPPAWPVGWIVEDPPLRPADRTTGGVQILFIGNSFTYSWGGLPNLVGALSRAGGQRPMYAMTTIPNGTLDQYWQRDLARQRLAERPAGGHWDYVVVQPHWMEAWSTPDNMIDYARRFDAEIRATGARTVLYHPWVRDDQTDKLAPSIEAFKRMVRQIDAIPENMAAGRKALVAPVGVAWGRVHAEHPRIGLYEPDHAHPRSAGSYLAACVFHATLFGQSPEGLPPRLADDQRTYIEIPAEHARILQRIAWETVQNSPFR